MLCDTILYYTILYCTVLYYTVLYYTILYYTILYYTILYYIGSLLFQKACFGALMAPGLLAITTLPAVQAAQLWLGRRVLRQAGYTPTIGRVTSTVAVTVTVTVTLIPTEI